MLDKLLPALFLTICTGLSILASKHPAAFKQIFSPLYIAMIIIAESFFIWDAAVLFSFDSILRFVNGTQLKEAMAVMSNIQAPWWVFALVVAFLLYMHFLAHLAKLIQNKPVDREGNGASYDKID